MLPLLIALVGCNKQIYQIKVTTDGHLNIDELTNDNVITAVGGKNLDLHLQTHYYHNLETDWEILPTKTNEGKLKDPNIKYLINVNDIQVLIDGKINSNAFTLTPGIKSKSTLTLKKEFIRENVEIKISTHTYSEKMHLCLFGCEISDALKDRIDKKEILIHFESQYQNHLVPIKTLGTGTIAYPVIEDDTMVMTFKVDQEKSKEPLPNNLWFRTNARYAKIDDEFTRIYGDNNMTCVISVPHYIMKDHCEIRNNI